MTPVLADGADSTDTHLISTTKELQTLLVLRADLPVQVPKLIHQFVSLESSRLVVGLQVFLTVRGQAVEAGLDGFEFLSRAEVTSHVRRSSKTPIGWRHHVEVQASLLDLLSHFREGCIGSEHRSLCESDPALRTDVNPSVVSLIPVATNAVHTEAVATGDGHWVSQETRAQVAAEVIWGHRLSHVHLTHARICSHKQDASKHLFKLTRSVCECESKRERERARSKREEARGLEPCNRWGCKASSCTLNQLVLVNSSGY